MNVPGALAWTILTACVLAGVYFGSQTASMQTDIRHQADKITKLADKIEALEGGNGAIIRMESDIGYLKREVGELSTLVRGLYGPHQPPR